jgi:hypothetical protein
MGFKMKMVFINNSNNIVNHMRQSADPVPVLGPDLLLNMQNSLIKRHRGTFYFKNSNNSGGGGCSSCGH